MRNLKRLLQEWSLFTVICCLLFIVGCAQNKEKHDPETFSKAQQIDELITEYANYDGYNGTVLIAHQGKVILKKAYGLANKEWDVANTIDTKFRIASITKSFTAMLIMQMVESNTLELHVPISNYLPDYDQENGNSITIHHLLTHSSGTVRDNNENNTFNKYPDRAQIKDLVRAYSSIDLEFKPGEKFNYSNSGYLTLGYIIETVTGKSFEDVLKERILTPLGMKNTGIDKHRILIENRAYGYFKGFGDYFNTDYGDMSKIPAVGNMYSTVEDMYLWDRALDTDQLLSKKYRDLLFTKHIKDIKYGGHYGYGWELMEKPVGTSGDYITTIGHSGSMQGFCALYTKIASTDSSIIFLNNTGRAYLNAMTTAITGILNEQPYDKALKPLALFMKKTIDKDGIKKGIAFFKKHQNDPEYSISETDLIVTGYKKLHAGNAQDASLIFKLAIETFPDRDNPYDSYAESLMELGQHEEAIKNYKKSLELNPNNRNAVRMIKKIEVTLQAIK